MIRRRNAVAGAVAKLVVAAIVASIAILAVAATALAGVIPTDKGPVRGTSTAQTNQYLGIPYAAPPVGDLRWRAAQSGPRAGTARATQRRSRPTARRPHRPSASPRPPRTACT